jgi:hypothetical protein
LTIVAFEPFGFSSPRPSGTETAVIMSSFLFPIDHIGYLVNLGFALDVNAVVTPARYQPLSLSDADDRRYVACELIRANRASVGAPLAASEIREFPCGAIAPALLSEFVQALQWVRCYQYQSSEAPTWIESFAHAFTERLRDELEVRIISCFRTSWVHGEAEISVAE